VYKKLNKISVYFIFILVYRKITHRRLINTVLLYLYLYISVSLARPECISNVFAGIFFEQNKTDELQLEPTATYTLQTVIRVVRRTYIQLIWLILRLYAISSTRINWSKLLETLIRGVYKLH